MEVVDLVPLIESLDDNIDDLEEALGPLLKITLSETAGKLPLLDRAQLYVLVTYAIESIIFSYLRLNGVNAKAHPVFDELTRVKQYFQKIKVAESAETQQNTRLDKAAAGRFIKHALARNDHREQNLARTEGKERGGAHIRFGEAPIQQKPYEIENVEQKAVCPGDDSNSESSESLHSRKRREGLDDQRFNNEILVEHGGDLGEKDVLGQGEEAVSNIDGTDGRRKQLWEKKRRSRKRRKLLE